MEYTLLRNYTCVKDEIIIQIPNFITDHMLQYDKDGSNNEFMIFGFVWKEFIFGLMIVIIFLICFCGGGKGNLLPQILQRLLALLSAMVHWILGARRSHQQFNYNDYID